jgi:tol-pal system protein YbgF
MFASQTPSLRWAQPAAGLLLIAAAWSHGAVPVEESVGTTRSGTVQPAPAPRPSQAPAGAIDARSMDTPSGGAESSRFAELFYQLQVLQQEVQELRGMVEEQSHQLSRLARDQQEQYLDLDRRMQAVRGGGQAASATASASGVAPAGEPALAGASERDAYSAAFEQMRQRQFDESIRSFQAFVRNYPNGAYTANAFYWLGELYLAQNDNEQARQSFVQVVNLYPDHQKVPDALYKLGVVYHRLGDLTRAREYLTRVRDRHPGSSAAGLAQTYLAEL